MYEWLKIFLSGIIFPSFFLFGQINGVGLNLDDNYKKCKQEVYKKFRPSVVVCEYV